MKTVVLLALGAVLTAQALANQAHDRISALSDAQRSTLFSKMLKSEDAACSTITRTFYRGSDKTDSAYWSVQCQSNKAYQIQVSPNATGSTKLLDCAVAKKLSIDCFSKFK